MTYLWQLPSWPAFTWHPDVLLSPLAAVRKAQGQLLGAVLALSDTDQLTHFARCLAADAIGTAAIEDVALDESAVRTAVASHLGLSGAGLSTAPRAVNDLTELLLAATRLEKVPLTPDRLFRWHNALFSSDCFGRLHVGSWREDAMQVVSGARNHETVHFEAPPPEAVPQEMARFFAWWNGESHSMDGLLRAAVAHLYFVTIHPFEDGNGRLARALADRALAEDDHFCHRYYSLSATIMARRAEYYDELQAAQQGAGDITSWLLWFIGAVSDAVATAKLGLETMCFKARFWQQHAEDPVSPRQKKVLNRLLDAGQGGFTGGLSTRKYQSLTSTSRATAWRELNELVQLGLLRPVAGASGRNTAYEIPWPEDLPSRAAV